MSKICAILFLLVVLSVASFPAVRSSHASSVTAGAEAFHNDELIFPLESWHNHASAIVECSNGDLLVCWFHGSGERTADDVKVEGARLRKGSKTWNRFTMADTPGYPDTNCTMFIDPQGRLWLLWPTILANEWHTALMKYRISSDYQRSDGPPKWETNEVLHISYTHLRAHETPEHLVCRLLL